MIALLAFAVPLQIFDLGSVDVLDDVTDSGDTAWEWAELDDAPGGEGVWGFATAPGRFYGVDALYGIELLLPDLSTASEPVLVFEHWYDVATDGDRAVFEVDEGTGWFAALPTYGYPGGALGYDDTADGWLTTSLDLSAYSSDVRVRLALYCEGAAVRSGWHVRAIGLYDGDATAPYLASVLEPTNTETLDGAYWVEVVAVDDVLLSNVILHLQAGAAPPTSLPLTSLGGDNWGASMNLGAVAPDTVVQWHVTASDNAGSLSRYPPVDEASFRVYLEAPTALQGPVGRVVAQDVRLNWLPPVSTHSVVGYSVYASPSDDLVGQTQHTTLDVPTGDHSAWYVRAIYEDALEGDATDVLQVDVEVPELLSVEPSTAFQGDLIRVQVQGRALYLSAESPLDFGSGVEVISLDVLDAYTAYATLHVADDAAIGSRDLDIDVRSGTAHFEGVFSIDDGADRPQVIDVSPMVIYQGREVEIEVQTNQVFEPHAALTVDAGPGVTVTSQVVVTGDSVHFSVLPDSDATLGPRTVVIDDGQRLLPLSLEVRASGDPNLRNCSSVAATGAWWWVLAGLLAVTRRRRQA